MTSGAGLAARRSQRAARRGAAGIAVLALAFSVLPASPAQADTIRDGQYWLAEYGITDAWATSRGAGVTVAIIDSGVDGSHPDLQGAVVGGTDVSGIGITSGQKGVGNSPAHGTLVASLVAGRGHGDGQGDGMIGVAPEASILTVSVAFGVTGLNTDEQIAQGIIWAVDNGADVINMSLTRNNPDWPESWDKAFLYAYEHDVVIVAAAGNRASGTTQVGAPATIPGVLTVAGLDRNGNASFDASSQGVTISVAAPSEKLYGAMPGGGYAQWDGTSGATPIVSGLVALIRSQYPKLDAGEVIDRITATATPKGTSRPDPIYGYGAIDASAALSASAPAAVSDPLAELQEWIRLYRRAPVAGTDDPAAETPDDGTGDGSAGEGSGGEDEDPDGSGAVDIWAAGAPNAGSADPGPAVLLFVGFGALFILLMVGAGRHFWRILRKE